MVHLLLQNIILWIKFIQSKFGVIISGLTKNIHYYVVGVHRGYVKAADLQMLKK